MHSFSAGQRALVAVLSIMVVPAAFADPIAVRDVAGEVMKQFTDYPLNENILDAAKTLFTFLATISLVWTMGMLILRQDIGEMLMELLRFIVVTGTFYWLLINASAHDGTNGFVGDIVSSFFNMVNDSASDELIRNKANSILARGLHVFYKAVDETSGGDDGDRLLAGGIALAVLVVCAIMAAQFLLALVMAWVLGYAGIFLLGFGGARWTSSIAINFYKHVVAIGVALLALSIVGTVAAGFLDQLEFDPNRRGATDFPNLGLMLAGSIVMMVLSTKLPQLLYTLVTGSTLGMYAGSASAAGTAIASAGAAAVATAAARLPGGGGHGGFAAGHAESGRTDSVMGAVQRSASSASGMSDPFHVGTAADSFGTARSSNPYHQTNGGSVFAATQSAYTTGPASISSPVAMGGGRAPASVDDAARGGPAPAGAAARGDVLGDSGRVVSTGAGATEIPGEDHGTSSAGVFARDGGREQPDYLAELESIEAAVVDAESGRANHLPGDTEGAQAIEAMPDSLKRSDAAAVQGMSGGSESAADIRGQTEHVPDVGDQVAPSFANEVGTTAVGLARVAEPIGLPDEREVRHTGVDVSTTAQGASGETDVVSRKGSSADETLPTSLPEQQRGDLVESTVSPSGSETIDDATVHGATSGAPHVALASQPEGRIAVEGLAGATEPVGLPDERKVLGADVEVATATQGVNGEIEVAAGENSRVDETMPTSLPDRQPGDVNESIVPSSRSEEARNGDVEISTIQSAASEIGAIRQEHSIAKVPSVPPVDDEQASAHKKEDGDQPPATPAKRPGGKVIPPPPIDDASTELPE